MISDATDDAIFAAPFRYPLCIAVPQEGDIMLVVTGKNGLETVIMRVEDVVDGCMRAKEREQAGETSRRLSVAFFGAQNVFEERVVSDTCALVGKNGYVRRLRGL